MALTRGQMKSLNTPEKISSRKLRQRPASTSHNDSTKNNAKRTKFEDKQNSRKKIKVPVETTAAKENTIQRKLICYNPQWPEELGILKSQLALLPSKEKCVFCHSSKDDPEVFGKFIHHTYTGLKVHNFCMLLASGLSQHYEDDGNMVDNELEYAIYGFLIFDIFKELQRCSVLRCSLCNKPGAPIGCAIKKCKKMFHYPCALKKNALPQFFGTFNTFCVSHRPLQDFLPEVQEVKKGKYSIGTLLRKLSEAKNCKVLDCSICMEGIKCVANGMTCLASPCCKDSWFHRTCIQQYAKSSAMYFFKCPKCKNEEKFMKEMQRMGVYIPDCDASWERSSDAFSDLLQRHNICDAEDCKCPFGNKYTEPDSAWAVVLCDLCGSSGVHIACDDMVDSKHSAFACHVCVSMHGWKNVRSLSIEMGIISRNSDIYLDKIREEDKKNKKKAFKQSKSQKVSVIKHTATVESSDTQRNSIESDVIVIHGEESESEDKEITFKKK